MKSFIISFLIILTFTSCASKYEPLDTVNKVEIISI